MAVYPQNLEEKIGFDKIKNLISKNCIGEAGKEFIEKISFSTDKKYIYKNLKLTEELINIINHYDNFPISSYKDARDFLKRIIVEGLFLDIPELIILRNSLETINDIVNFFEGKEDDFPLMSTKAKKIQLFPYISRRLNEILTKSGQIKDNASPELFDIRKLISSKTSSISRKMNAILQKAQQDGFTDKETTISIRDGKMLIPLPSGNKRKISGIVHDESATGKTSYIEPTEIVEINNEIRELEIEERREIHKILRTFANDIRPYINDIIPGYNFLAEVDFIRAKAIFANKISAVVPDIIETPTIEWYNAKHPLLLLSLQKTAKKIIPLNIRLSEEDRILLISGPNAGGKSVCLKTTGLLQYMFQCSIPVSVSIGSIFGIFKNILIDMGDEQSIENDLSTYSSHLINMKNFVKIADDKSLILIDEFGTGTEPSLGGAIAEAVLNNINEKKVKGVITTHYANLKHFASQTKGVINGAMLYDAQNMSPLFKLEIGKPGSSFAFEIAKKIGLPKDIIDDAAKKVGEEHIYFDKHLKDILRDKNYWQEKRRKIHQTEKNLDEKLSFYSQEIDEIKKTRRNIIEEAKKQAEDIIKDANKAIEKTIKEIKEKQAEKETTKQLRKELEKKREHIIEDDENDEIIKKIEKIKNRKSRKKVKTEENKTVEIKDDKIKIGDYVYTKTGAIGEVIEIKSNNIIIAIGSIRSIVKDKEVKKVSANKKKQIIREQSNTKRITYSENISKRKIEFKQDIDIRGLRVDEALEKIRDFVDNASMLGVANIRILHGTGTGALRQFTRDYLKTNPVVKSIKDEHVQLGGAGISVIELDL